MSLWPSRVLVSLLLILLLTACSSAPPVQPTATPAAKTEPSPDVCMSGRR